MAMKHVGKGDVPDVLDNIGTIVKSSAQTLDGVFRISWKKKNEKSDEVAAKISAFAEMFYFESGKNFFL